ncbi:SRPBCC family protein, partial [Ralstonia pseudosolanacearum]|uniref:SRPBCC family protein n=2 Tax=Ralstonia pseudosolanacearum TaxID=1310165 RepID=UPI003CF990D9
TFFRIMATPRSKLETSKDVKCEAHKLYGMFKYTFHHLTEAFPESFKSCEILQGDGGVGTIRLWKYVMPGKTELQSCTEKVEVQDDEKMLIVLDIYDGDHIADYPFFKIIVHITPKGEGCSVKWVIEFEKGHEGVIDPHHHLDLHEKIIEKLEAHIVAKA